MKQYPLRQVEFSGSLQSVVTAHSRPGSSGTSSPTASTDAKRQSAAHNSRKLFRLVYMMIDIVIRRLMSLFVLKS